MSNTKLVILLLVNMAIWAALIFGIQFLFGDRLDTKHPFKISEGGRRGLFFGIPAIGFGILMCKAEVIAHAVGERAYPYVYFGMFILLAVIGMVLYNHVPKRWIIPLGISGWVTTFSLTFWYFWFGPGAFGHVAF